MLKRTAFSIGLMMLAQASAHAYTYRFDEQNAYMRAYGGISYAEGSSNHYTAASSSLKVTYHPAFNGGVNLGYRYNEWRLEYEFSHAKYKHRSFNLDTVKIEENGDLTLNTHFVNLLYSFSDEYYSTVPFFGAGMGVADVQMEGYKDRFSATVVANGDSEHEFAYQGIVGIGYYLSKNTMFDLTFRHLGTSQGKRTSNDEHHSNTLLAGFTYHFA